MVRRVTFLVGVALISLAMRTPAHGVFVIDPFGIDFAEDLLPSLRVAGSAALYVVRGSERFTVTSAEISADGAEARCRVSDGRSATVRMGEGPQGSTRVSFSATPKDEFEKLGVTLLVSAKDGFYGLMERVVQGSQSLSWKPGMTAGLSLRGQVVDLYTLPTVSIYAPFFVASSGWGLWVEGSWPGTYRFGVDARGALRPTQIEIEIEGPALQLLLLPGPEPLAVVERYARITGMPLLPPRFLLGPGRWRDECWDLDSFYDRTPYDGPFNSMVVEDALMMQALGIPCSWIVVDRPWAEGTFGYGGLSFDENRFPALAEMVEWLGGRGVKTLLWIGPWVMDGERETALARGYTVQQALPYLPEAALIDFTNPDAVAWWMSLLQPLVETGIAGFKLDRGEEKPPDGQVFRGAYSDGTDYREGHNAFPLWFAHAAFDTGASFGGPEFVSIYRAGWSGMSQWTAAWGGDTDPSEWGLRSAIIALQRAAILNTPLWGSDTGGYNRRAPREVLARWLAFSAFCPIMEVGPTANLAPWSWLPDDHPGEATESGYPSGIVYDAELIAIWSLYANLHADLGEYLYRAAEAAHERGTPIVRPLIVAYPDDERFVDAFEQYLLGPDLLVRPVWERGVDRVDVLVPQGAWIDAWTGVRVLGPCTVAADAPLHRLPLFVREGSDLSLGDLTERWRDAVARTASPPDLSRWVDEVTR
ncbi:MAG: TIM-barrel domain-containing protein [Candidatus Bipolaricaulota bacterium]